ncbi:MAG: hypothetical protein OXG81_17175 [Acidobacteria bacterium]|nr:hypothetical protein [Acidobacteriota bacterium]
MKKKFPTIAASAGGVILMVVVYASARFIGETVGSTARTAFSPNPTTSELLAAAVTEVNKMAPLVVDGVELMNAVGFDETITYNYRFVDLEVSDLDQALVDEVIADEVKPGAIRQACSTPDTRNGVLDQGLKMRYVYHDMTRVYLTEFTISVADCR